MVLLLLLMMTTYDEEMKQPQPVWGLGADGMIPIYTAHQMFRTPKLKLRRRLQRILTLWSQRCHTCMTPT